eukprot:4212620-Prymnesium_polylepis.1
MATWIVRPSGPAGAGFGVQPLSRPLSRDVLPISASPMSTSMQLYVLVVPTRRSAKKLRMASMPRSATARGGSWSGFWYTWSSSTEFRLPIDSGKTLSERIEAADGLRQLCQLVTVQIELCECVQLADRLGQHRQTVAARVQPRERSQAADCLGQRDKK